MGAPSQPTPGWYPDPVTGQRKYWDGSAWSAAAAISAEPAGGHFFLGPDAQPQASSAPYYLPNLIAAIIASVGIVVGSIGPWLTFMAVTRNAMDGDGIFTLILGIVSAAALFVVLNLGRGRAKKGWMVALGNVAVAAAIITFLIAAYDAREVMSRKADLFGTTLSAQIGWGLWMVLISSVLLAITASVVVRQIPKLLQS